MHIKEKIQGEVAVVVFDGDLLDENDSSALRQKISSLLIDGIRKIVFDLRSLRQINKNGLDTMLGVFRQTRAYGGDIRIAQIDAEPGNLFVKTRLANTFTSYETVGRALASFMT
ncbi:MAG TPA: STAS domain-containing protein [Bacteroidota bacterium]|nr:STAS domain-containing protein [Bacteroidota bacterium]